MTESLETESFIRALCRFISRRGTPKMIRGNNGMKLSSGEREIPDHHQKNIKRKFNFPEVSHMGGVWERMIRLVRKILRALFKQQLVLETHCQRWWQELMEFSMVDHWLLTMACSPIDSPSSTTDHLLLRWHLNLPPGVFVKNDLYCHRRWKLVQYLPGVFSRRWFS